MRNPSISENATETPVQVLASGQASPAKAQRHLGFDFLRVVATYMVMQIHTGEFYYIGSGGVVLSTADAYWVGWLNSLFRACVPLFVMLSGFYLFPVTDDSKFFRKRFSRVLTPFVVWCALYALYFHFRGNGTLTAALTNVLKIPVNYGTEVGHLWFVYMLLGIYLFAPVISPWIQSASRRSLEVFLLLWGLTLTVPYIHLYFPAVWGECYWNRTPSLYYFSGFLGYVVLAVYIKRFWMRPSALHSLAGMLLILAGYAITAWGFLHRLPVEHVVSRLELTWGFETINVAMMTTGVFLLFKNLHPSSDQSACWTVIRDISRRSYGMYLAHIMVLNAVFQLLDKRFASAAIKLPLIALLTFAATYLLMKALSLLPHSKWLVG
jgi:surface polysaccharide O-acyltransferase-like enzyme